jgi:NAD-dependent SIR2 family protein deacetylase
MGQFADHSRCTTVRDETGYPESWCSACRVRHGDIHGAPTPATCIECTVRCWSCEGSGYARADTFAPADCRQCGRTGEIWDYETDGRPVVKCEACDAYDDACTAYRAAVAALGARVPDRHDVSALRALQDAAAELAQAVRWLRDAQDMDAEVKR